MYKKTKYIPSGDCGIVMEFGNEISVDINRKVREVVNSLEKEKINGIVEWIPTYRSIMLIYNPSIISYKQLLDRIKILEERHEKESFAPPLVVEIPTVYGGSYGPDINYVAEYNNLSEEEVIKIHSGEDYLIYMLGFTPGFPYLGGMSGRIATPRLKNPREKIIGGSVGIAEKQTGIYPIDSPGGWQLIGKTPVKLFDPEKGVFLLKAGDYIRFLPIDEKEYTEIEREVTKDKYKVKKYPMKKVGDQI